MLQQPLDGHRAVAVLLVGATIEDAQGVSLGRRRLLLPHLLKLLLSGRRSHLQVFKQASE